MTDAPRPVMTDVARLAGVSYQTVSRVLNDHPSVRPTTRARVRQAMTTLGYRPNPAARTLAGGRSRLIGVAAPASTLFGPSSLLHAVERAAREAGYVVMVTVPDDHLADAFERLVLQGVEGIVALAPVVGEADSLPRDTPTVVLHASVEPGRAFVAIDQFTAARDLTDHLLAQGARTVWHVAGPDDWHDARARVGGWRAALDAAGIHPPEVLRGDWSADSGYECGRALAARTDVDAVFVANDHMALGVLHALRDHGRDVPGDVLVAGFDDVPESAHFAPPLTTARQDFGEVGRRAIELLTEVLDGGTTDVRSLLVPAELVLRASTVRPGGRG